MKMNNKKSAVQIAEEMIRLGVALQDYASPETQQRGVKMYWDGKRILRRLGWA